METIDKPEELLALHDVSQELFDTLKDWFAVPDEVSLPLGDVDAAVMGLSDPTMIAALAMRKLQALRLLAQPGVRTSTDVVVAIVQDLERALVQAPSLRLRLAARSADWDAALEALMASDEPGESDAPQAVTDGDPEVERFRDRHRRLHEALRAVVEASDGEIRYLV